MKPILLVLVLAACDPVYEVNGTIVVDLSAQETAPLPSQLLLRITAPVDQSYADRLAILCDAQTGDLVATWRDGGVCAIETTYEAWLAPLTDGATECGVLPEPVKVDPVPAVASDAPRDVGTVFRGQSLSNCVDGDEAIELVLTGPS